MDILDIAYTLKENLLQASKDVKQTLDIHSSKFGIGVTNTAIANNCLEFTLESSVYSKLNSDDEGLLISVLVKSESVSDAFQISMEIDMFRSNGVTLESRRFIFLNYEDSENAAQLKEATLYIIHLRVLLEKKLLEEYIRIQ